MYRQDFFRIELQILKDVKKSPSEVFPTSNQKVPNFWVEKKKKKAYIDSEIDNNQLRTASKMPI